VEGESIWLDPARTTPFEFFQYWLQTDDRDIGTYLRWFTEFPREEVERLDAEVAARPEARAAQRALARDITARTHGEAAAAQAEADSEALFSPGPIRDAKTLAALHDSTNGFEFTQESVAKGTNTLLTEAGLFSSKSEGRRLVASGGVTINGTRLTDPDAVPQLIDGTWLDVRIGKRRREIGRLTG
jgi:tyrosyl-tRNA synthetase